MQIKYINLFDFVLDYLKSRNLLDKAITMQQEKGDATLIKALSGPPPLEMYLTKDFR